MKIAIIGNLEHGDSLALGLRFLHHGTCSACASANDGHDAVPELDSSDLRMRNLQEELLAKEESFARLTKQDSQHYKLTDAHLEKWDRLSRLAP